MYILNRSASLLLLLVVAAVPISTSEARPSKFDDLINEAQHFYDAGRYPEAASKYKAAFVLRPKDRRLLLSLGQTYLAVRCTDAALTYCRRFLKEAARPNSHDKERAQSCVTDAEKILTRPPSVTAKPVFIDFQTRNRGQTPGCACGDGTMVFPNGPYSAHVGEDLRIRYDASTICRGQGFTAFSGTVSWAGNLSSPMANNNNNGEFPGIAGTFVANFSKPGDYTVTARFALDCVDVNCRNTCQSTAGVTSVHIADSCPLDMP